MTEYSSSGKIHFCKTTLNVAPDSLFLFLLGLSAWVKSESGLPVNGLRTYGKFQQTQK